MAIVAVAGDACTTTTVALASAWSASDDVVVVEADPFGGDLAAWFDVPEKPSLSTVVTSARDGSWSAIEGNIRTLQCGLRVIPAPTKAVEAGQAVREAGFAVVATVASRPLPVTIVDIGRLPSQPSSNPFLAAAAVVVVVHRQSTQSARAAAARLQRFADDLDAISGMSATIVAAIIGARPFDVGEIGAFLEASIGSISVVALPVDELSAAVLAGRSGVSERRLLRLPLMRDAFRLAQVVDLVLSRSDHQQLVVAP